MMRCTATSTIQYDTDYMAVTIGLLPVWVDANVDQLIMIPSATWHAENLYVSSNDVVIEMTPPSGSDSLTCTQGKGSNALKELNLVFISHLCYDVSVRLSVTEVYWCIIANLGFKFRSQFTAHWGKWSMPAIVEGSSRAMLAAARPSC